MLMSPGEKMAGKNRLFSEKKKIFDIRFVYTGTVQGKMRRQALLKGALPPLFSWLRCVVFAYRGVSNTTILFFFVFFFRFSLFRSFSLLLKKRREDVGSVGVERSRQKPKIALSTKDGCAK